MLYTLQFKDYSVAITQARTVFINDKEKKFFWQASKLLKEKGKCEYICANTALEGREVYPLFDEQGNLIHKYAKELVTFLLVKHGEDMSKVRFEDSDFKKMDPSICAFYGLSELDHNDCRGHMIICIFDNCATIAVVAMGNIVVKEEVLFCAVENPIVAMTETYQKVLAQTPPEIRKDIEQEGVYVLADRTKDNPQDSALLITGIKEKIMMRFCAAYAKGAYNISKERGYASLQEK